MDHPNLVKRLNLLLTGARRSQYGYERCAEHARNPALSHWLLSRSEQHRCHPQAFQTLLRDAGGSSFTESLTPSALNFGWASTKGVMTGYPDTAMLHECERMEETALSRYQDAMDSEDLSVDASALVQGVLESTKANVRTIRQLQASRQGVVLKSGV